jgi:fused signal recognition particle receptor
MSFFRKLKDRMFKSSSKLDEGLDAIIEEGAEDETGGGPGAHDPAHGSERRARRRPPRPTWPWTTCPAEFLEEEPPSLDRSRSPGTGTGVNRSRRGCLRPNPTRTGSPSRAPPRPAPDLTPDDLRPRAGGRADADRRRARAFGRLMGRKRPVPRRALDDDMLEQLEELLITADMGVETAMRVTANMAEGRYGRMMSAADIKELLATEVARVMEPVARPLPLYPKKPQVVLVVGVNGSGKTTTIGKLASQFKAAGKQVVIAAGDTFRAAAVEQLQVWGERAGVPVLTAPEGSDPAALAFDAMGKAEAEGADLLMIDTAGRLQNRADLMEELAKIVRVIRKKDPDAPHNTLLVLDATTGQNALSQVKTSRRWPMSRAW